jgi:hypothetical protein
MIPQWCSATLLIGGKHVVGYALTCCLLPELLRVGRIMYSEKWMVNEPLITWTRTEEGSRKKPIS